MIHPVTGEKLNYRYCFEAEPGSLVVSSDFSGQELGVMFALSGDEVGCRILNAKGDIHGEAAAGMFNIPFSEVKNPIPGLKGVTYRDRGKILVFSLAYGKTAEGFAKDWGIPLEEAKKLIKGFSDKFKQLTRWLAMSADVASASRVATLANGAMRYVGGSLGRSADAAAKRQGANAQIQGLSAWMTRRAIIHLDNKVLRGGLVGVQLNVPIHDELLCVIKRTPECELGILKAGDDEIANELKKRWAELKKQPGEKEAEAAFEAHVETKSFDCGCEHCAHRYITEIGDSMKAAGEYYLQGKVPAGFSTATAKYWEH